MGQYHKLYNLDKKEFINPHAINNGLKLREQLSGDKSTAAALFLLIANSNGRGGGDVNDHDLIGTWSGDRVLVQGDYSDENDAAFISDNEISEFIDISEKVNDMLKTAI